MNKHNHRTLLSLGDLLPPPARCFLDQRILEEMSHGCVWLQHAWKWSSRGTPATLRDGHYSPGR